MNSLSRDVSALQVGRNMKSTAAVSDTMASRVGFLLLDNFSLTCFSQSLDVLSTANLISPGSVSIHTFSSNDAEVTSDLAIPIRPSMPLTDIRLGGLDLMIICGGLRTPRAVPKWLTALLQKLSRLPMILGGLWNGAWYLEEAGLLDGYKCAIHPEQRMALSERVPHASVTLDPLVVDRDRFTAATPVGAFHMMVKWLGMVRGEKLSNAVLNALDYDTSRFRRNFSPHGKPLCRITREVITLMESNLEEPLDSAQISTCVGLSLRQIQRRFRKQLGTTLQKYYLELRITEARRLLQNANVSVVDAAIACGFVSPSHFSRNYSALFGYPPSKERRCEY